MIRRALYAGTWYPTSKQEIAAYMPEGGKKFKAKALFCPHAGWVYSGRIAGEVFAASEPAELYVLIGPNHHGAGTPVGIWSDGTWQTPLGNIEVESRTAADILKRSAAAQPDSISHAQEHSLEVQLPFIKLISPEAKIVPIALADYSPKTCKELGEAVAAAVKFTGYEGSAVIVASTDMSHYISAESAKKADMLAVKRILELDPEGLLETVKRNDISMCGSGPAAAALWAAKKLGATQAELIRYATSGDVTGDNSEVVGYAGLLAY